VKQKLNITPQTAAWLWCLASSLPQNLSADPLDHWHWRSPEPTTNTLLGVTCGGGKSVAVGEAGTIVASTDGTAWNLSDSGTSASLRGVTFGGGMFLAVGEGGTILTSSNAVDWKARDSGTTNDLYAATYGQDLIVTVGAGGTLTTSRDGIAWEILPGSKLVKIFSRPTANNKPKRK
jgi:hypothetical protein